MRKVPLEDVQPGDVAAVDIKIYSDDPNVQYRVRVDKGRALTQTHLDRLSREGVGYIFIRDADLKDLNPFIVDKELDKAEEELARELLEIGQDIQTGANYQISVKRLKNALEKLIDAVRETETMLAFSSLKAHDDYTAKHSVDVAKLALHLVLSNRSTIRDKLKSETGASTKYTNQYMLNDLGLGSLLHDIGKWTIPEEVLKKPASLDEQEWSAIKTHPNSGHEILQNQDNTFRAPVKAPILQHHEQYKGGGYPEDRSGKNIHLYGRIVSICDVYSALTSDRPYRLQKTPNRARETMQSMQDEKTYFDPELFEMFMEAVPPFPIGQQVVLSNGKRGVVCGLEENPQKPLVRILYEGEKRVDDPYEVKANTESGPTIVN